LKAFHTTAPGIEGSPLKQQVQGAQLLKFAAHKYMHTLIC